MKANKPSSTAIFVANGVWWVSRNKKFSALVPDFMGKLNNSLVSYVNNDLFTTHNKFGKWLLQIKTTLMQVASIPGFYVHFVLRKRVIEEFVNTAIIDGAEQVVVIGAGFDTLSLRVFKDNPKTNVFEIDHPATQKWKINSLQRNNHEFGGVHFLPLDLTKNTMQELLSKHQKYNQSKTTVYVAEGLLMYLTEKEVREILHFIRQFSGSKSRFVFTYMEENDHNKYQFKNASWITNFWLRIKGEGFKWGLKNEQLPVFLSESGFELLHFRTHKDLREKFFEGNGEPLPIGENIAVAQSN